MGIVFDTYGRFDCPLYQLGIVFDTYVGPDCLICMLVDTYERDGKLALLAGYRLCDLRDLGCSLCLLGIVFDTFERLGCLLFLPGIVFDTYVSVRLVTACDGYRFRYLCETRLLDLYADRYI